MFVEMPRSRPSAEVLKVFELKAAGHLDREVSELTGVPVGTIRNWRNRRFAGKPKPPFAEEETCPQCGGPVHETSGLPIESYSYLLGVYLGDGCVTRNGSSWALRVYLDASYPGIVREVCEAIHAIRTDRTPMVAPHRDCNCVVVHSTWRPWLCLFPQHGVGRKHTREIQLADWQAEIVDIAPGLFLRGLIHTDGWRGVNRVHAKGRNYEYPRYQFSNRSDDIRGLFTSACDKLGIKWRPWTRYHVSVAQRDSVALLDSFVGPKY
jgi:hypothetical protein